MRGLSNRSNRSQLRVAGALALALLIGACGEDEPSAGGAPATMEKAGAAGNEAAGSGAAGAEAAGAEDADASARTAGGGTGGTVTDTTKAATGRGTATITGTVRFAEGEPPRVYPIDMSADENCEELHDEPVRTETVVLDDDGMLQNVFVWVREGIGGTYDPPAQPVTLSQQGCTYHPHVFGIMVGQRLRIVNDDATLHNVHALPEENDSFNFGQPKKGDESFKAFDFPEVMVPFKCDVHNWMNCYAGVVPHPFFDVTGDGGSFTLGGLPGGTYVVQAWHETFGTVEQRVTVGDGESKSIEFSMGS